jgi:hypothetical protein
MIKPLLKKALLRVAPQTTTALLAARARAHSHRLIDEWGLGGLTRKLIDRFGATVQAGPFAGMVLSPMSHSEHLAPYLLGTYESEVHPWIKAILAQAPTQVVDIGARFGYYAVGFARSLRGAHVVAFDPDPWARDATREMARANGISSVEIRGYCTPRWLQENLLSGSVVFSDCEGFERELFCSATSPRLASSTAIIELHENMAPDITICIRRLFASTHDLALVSTGEKSVPAVDLSFLTAEEQQRALDELRQSGKWVLLTPKVARVEEISGPSRNLYATPWP